MEDTKVITGIVTRFDKVGKQEYALVKPLVATIGQTKRAAEATYLHAAATSRWPPEPGRWTRRRETSASATTGAHSNM